MNAGQLRELERAAARMDQAEKDFRALSDQIPDDVRARMRELHGQFVCAAENEGLWCCIDWLTGVASDD